MKPLYEISGNLQKIFFDLYDKDEISDEDMANIAIAEGELESKAIDIAGFVKNIEAEFIRVDDAMRSMNVRKKSLERKIDKISQYLKLNLEACGITTINKSPYFVIKIKKCPPSLIIDNESLIPEEYKHERVEFVIDKSTIKDKIKNGEIISGASIIQNTRLEIK